MITGRRIACSLIAAAALSLTLVPVAAAEPKAAPAHDHGIKPGIGISLVCKLTGKPHWKKPPALSENDLQRVIKLHDAKSPKGKVQSCKIISAVPGKRTVVPRGEDAPPAKESTK